MAWPDIVIAVALVLGTFSGLRRGLLGELTGTVALAAAILAAFTYSGGLDAWVKHRTHLEPGSAHIVAMVVFGLIAYAIVLAIGLVLSGFAKLPLLNVVNAVGGAGVGLVKSLLFVWIALYVALFFPLSRDLRADLHRSSLVALIEAPNVNVDGHLQASLPPYVRPFAVSLFDRHKI
jgi:uncharacterized membrane protein required for colicin V production